ncbi:MAG: hypothetical protein WAK11_12495 [Candidatus Cybelea sp.]
MTQDVPEYAYARGGRARRWRADLDAVLERNAAGFGRIWNAASPR